MKETAVLDIKRWSAGPEPRLDSDRCVRAFLLFLLCMRVCVCTCLGRPEDSLPQVPFTLVLWVRISRWLADQRSPGTYLSPQAHSPEECLLSVCWGDRAQLRPHAYMVVSLTTEL